MDTPWHSRLQCPSQLFQPVPVIDLRVATYPLHCYPPQEPGARNTPGGAGVPPYGCYSRILFSLNGLHTATEKPRRDRGGGPQVH